MLEVHSQVLWSHPMPSHTWLYVKSFTEHNCLDSIAKIQMPLEIYQEYRGGWGLIYFCVFICLFWDKVPCSPRWPQSCFVSQGALELLVSCFHLLTAGTVGLCCYKKQCWGLNSKSHGHQARASPTELRINRIVMKYFDWTIYCPCFQVIEVFSGHGTCDAQIRTASSCDVCICNGPTGSHI